MLYRFKVFQFYDLLFVNHPLEGGYLLYDILTDNKHEVYNLKNTIKHTENIDNEITFHKLWEVFIHIWSIYYSRIKHKNYSLKKITIP